jgi:hypothetical protein
MQLIGATTETLKKIVTYGWMFLLLAPKSTQKIAAGRFARMTL